MKCSMENPGGQKARRVKVCGRRGLAQYCKAKLAVCGRYGNVKQRKRCGAFVFPDS